MRQLFDEYVQQTNRWRNRAITPLDFSSVTDRAKPNVIIHPGWGKRPELLGKLLLRLAEEGFMPIGVDTRFGYSNSDYTPHSSSSIERFIKQTYRVPVGNPYFPSSSQNDNRYRLRRPTGLASLITELGITSASLVGHSEGGRITTTVAAKSSVLEVPQLVIVNSVGVGSMSGIAGRLIRTNTAQNELFGGSIDLSVAITSAIESTVFGATHPRRLLREKAVVQQANIWPLLDQIVSQGTEVTVMHGINDKLITFDEVAAEARKDTLQIIRTPGGHSNIYTDEVTESIVNTLRTIVK